MIQFFGAFLTIQAAAEIKCLFQSHKETKLRCSALNTVLGLINKHVLTGEINNLMRPRAGGKILSFYGCKQSTIMIH